MKTNDLIKITETAAMSFAVAAIIACVVWALSPSQANAEGETKVVAKTTPTATADSGATVTGTITKSTTKDGVDLVLNVKNPTEQIVTVQFQASLDRLKVPARMSRVSLPLQNDLAMMYSIKLQPGQKRKISIPSNVKMKAGEQAKLRVTLDKKRTTLSTASTPLADTKTKATASSRAK